jgi:chemotaxis protein MotB
MAGKKYAPRKRSEKPPSWIMTFADLMSLLLCFFVLLLSFSELEPQKFKVISGSLKEAFGVQRIENVLDIPKGIDLISKDFSDPSFVEQILKKKIRSAIRLARQEGKIRVKEDEVSITVTLPDHMLFDSGSAQLKEEALPILDLFREAIEETPHKVMVVGHTDNVPIHTDRFPSNWELSAARASSVIRHLLESGTLDRRRFTAAGKADTMPVAPNDTPESRAANRRVELIFNKKLAVKPVPRPQEYNMWDPNDMLKEEGKGHRRRRWPW